MGYGIKIQNVVASATLGVDIVLTDIVSKLEGIEYEPAQFPGVIMRIPNPKTAALIFSSGKIVCTGAKSPGESKEAVDRVVGKLKRTGVKIPVGYTMKIENIVASAKLDKELNLDNIAFTLENTEYEPEQFPGLVYRMCDPKVTFLLFGSGKVICTGGKTLADVKRAVINLDKKMLDF